MKYKLSLIIVCFLLLGFACSEKPDSPNFVFILVDDLGYFDLGYQGSTFYQTPNIDRLANESMIFTNGYAACQVCSPSRASIMTGQHPDRHGITDWIGAAMGDDWNHPSWGEPRGTKMLPAHYNTHLPHENRVLPEALKDAGYTTFYAGKWHLGDKGSLPTDHGFDINKGGFRVGSPAGGRFFSPYTNPYLEDGMDGESLTLRLAEETASFIKENKNNKFFACLAFYAVHAPLQTTRDRWSKYRDIAEVQGIAEKGYEMEKRYPIHVTQDNPVYAGMVETVDEAVGRVLETLKQEGLTENTVVLFTSDNGGVASGDAFATSLLPFRGGKGYQWEGGIRVPFLIKVPWLKKKGTKCETPVIATDFYPTILDLAGLEPRPDEHLDGVSLKPLLSGKDLTERAIFWHYPHYGNQGGDPSSIIRKGDWKLIYYHEDQSMELYNLREDMEEQHNLVALHPEKAEELSDLLLQRLAATGARFPTENPEYDPDKLRETIYKRSTDLRNHLENQRLEMLSKDWKPNKDWWGSEIIEE
ncbi:sulfatase [Bacteroidota bacterium]